LFKPLFGVPFASNLFLIKAKLTATKVRVIGNNMSSIEAMDKVMLDCLSADVLFDHLILKKHLSRWD